MSTRSFRPEQIITGARARHIGGSIFASNNAEILRPVGALQVRVIPEEDTHGLFVIADGTLLAKHPNGFSCHALATRLRDGSRADEQAIFIINCGGVITDEGFKMFNGPKFGTLEAALAELQRMIRAGHEYPDAHTAVVLNHKVDADQLRDAYDAACAR